jgi:hypothetical protein
MIANADTYTEFYFFYIVMMWRPKHCNLGTQREGQIPGVATQEIVQVQLSFLNHRGSNRKTNLHVGRNGIKLSWLTFDRLGVGMMDKAKYQEDNPPLRKERAESPLLSHKG